MQPHIAAAFIGLTITAIAAFCFLVSLVFGLPGVTFVLGGVVTVLALALVAINRDSKVPDDGDWP